MFAPQGTRGIQGATEDRVKGNSFGLVWAHLDSSGKVLFVSDLNPLFNEKLIWTRLNSSGKFILIFVHLLIEEAKTHLGSS